MNILLTGTNSQLRSEIRKRLVIFPYWKVYFFDILEDGHIKSEELERVILENKTSCIINCETFTFEDQVEDYSNVAYMLKILAIKDLASCVNLHKLKFIHISTNLVFDGCSNKPYVENDLANPQNQYGNRKLHVEHIIQAMCPNALIIRTSWLYSSDNFVQTIRSLAKMKVPMKMSYDQISSPTWVGDLAAAILAILKDPQAGISKKGIYHYSNEGVASMYDFAYEIIKLSGLDCPIYPVRTDDYPSREKKPYYSVLSKEKIKSDFGLIIPNWQKSLKKCIGEMAFL